MVVQYTHAMYPPFVDEWATPQLLNPVYLMKNRFQDEVFLIAAFQQWLEQFNVTSMYTNSARHELVNLDVTIIDIGVAKWIDRYFCECHQILQLYKFSGLSFYGISCSDQIYSDYIHPFTRRCRSQMAKVKAFRGYHCNVADAHKLC